MKRSVRIFAFVLASIFCFAAMSFGVFALDTCPDHPHQGLYTLSFHEDNAYYHKYYCSVCDFMFGVEDCNFMNDYDCTTRPYCILCDQFDCSEGAYYPTHDFSGAWKSVYQYHYKTCGHAGCLQETTQAHTFIETTIAGTVYLVCTLCGYNRAK